MEVEGSSAPCFSVYGSPNCVVLCKFCCSILSLTMIPQGPAESIACKRAKIKVHILRLKYHLLILTEE